MGAVGSLTWRILLSLAFIINLYKVYCSESTVYKTGKGLKQTIAEDQMPEIAKKAMEQKLLALMGLHQRPNPIKNNAIEKSSAQFMLKLYNKIRSDNEDERPGMGQGQLNSMFNNSLVPDIHEINGSDLIVSFVNHASRLPFLANERDRLFYFILSDVSPDEILTTAELKLYKEPSREPNISNCLIEIFRIRRGNDSIDKILEPEANLTVSKDHEGWLSIKVTNAANYWSVYPTENLGLYMRVTDVEMGQEIDPDTFGIVGEDAPENKQLFMIGIFKNKNEEHVWPTRSPRERQNFSPTEEDTDDYSLELGGYSASRQSDGLKIASQACQRHQLYVSFKSLGWDSWIIAPAGYNAFYCGGECTFPLVDHLNATRHATVQSIVHTANPVIPKPCCAPKKLSQIQLLYHDDNLNVVSKLYQEMVVDACGCL